MDDYNQESATYDEPTIDYSKEDAVPTKEADNSTVVTDTAPSTDDYVDSRERKISLWQAHEKGQSKDYGVYMQAQRGSHGGGYWTNKKPRHAPRPKIHLEGWSARKCRCAECRSEEYAKRKGVVDWREAVGDD